MYNNIDKRFGCCKVMPQNKIMVLFELWFHLDPFSSLSSVYLHTLFSTTHMVDFRFFFLNTHPPFQVSWTSCLGVRGLSARTAYFRCYAKQQNLRYLQYVEKIPLEVLLTLRQNNVSLSQISNNFILILFRQLFLKVHSLNFPRANISLWKSWSSRGIMSNIILVTFSKLLCVSLFPLSSFRKPFFLFTWLSATKAKVFYNRIFFEKFEVMWFSGSCVKWII